MLNAIQQFSGAIGVAALGTVFFARVNDLASHPERGDEDQARPAADSACGVVWAANLVEDGPTGGFFRDGHLVA
jgi:hypothetical protein